MSIEMSGISCPSQPEAEPFPAGTETGVERIYVDLGARSYDILVGDGLLASAGPALRGVVQAAARVPVVTDETVAALHLPALMASLRTAGFEALPVILPAGEPTKDFLHLQWLCERLLDMRIERGSLLLALGGGVIGDIAGFAAAILLRGIEFVQLPTTLLAQVDSSVGGKTGINTAQGKNLVGAFHQPRLVLADVGVLATLDDRQRRAGYAEVVKYGLINDPAFFAWLEFNGPGLLAGDPELLRRAVAVSCRAKARVVEADEREAGLRALLNLGHTFGHALEAESGFSDALLHGEAVAIGMVLAFELSARMGLAPVGDVRRLRRHLQACGLPCGLDHPALLGASPRTLIAHMWSDKKVASGRLTFILARGIGSAFVCRDVPIESVEALLADACTGVSACHDAGGSA